MGSHDWYAASAVHEVSKARQEPVVEARVNEEQQVPKVCVAQLVRPLASKVQRARKVHRESGAPLVCKDHKDQRVTRAWPVHRAVVA